MRILFLFLALPVALVARQDLYDRNEGQQDFNPYDYPGSVQPNNPQSIYWPESRRLEQMQQSQGYNQESYYYQNQPVQGYQQ